MKRVFRLIRGKKEEHVVPLSHDPRVWYVVRSGSDNQEGDIVCSRRLETAQKAAKRVCPWRTRVTSHDLVLLRPAEGWGKDQEVVSPYRELLRFPDPSGRPDPAA